MSTVRRSIDDVPEARAAAATRAADAPAPVAQLLDRLRHLSESERLLADAVDAIGAAPGARRATAWLRDEGRFRLVASSGFGDGAGLPAALPELLAALFPSHIDPSAPVGPGLAPRIVPVPPSAEAALLDATLLVTLPGPQLVEGVLLLGGRDVDAAERPLLAPLAQEIGRTLSQLGALAARPGDGDSRVEPAARFLARLEEELARAERFRRTLTILWIEADLPAGFAEQGGERAVSQLAARIGAWLASRLRVMDIIGRRGDRVLVAVLPETSRAGAEILKARLLALAAEQGFGLPRATRTGLRLRVGMAAYPEEGVSSRFLLLAAERDAAQGRPDRAEAAGGEPEALELADFDPLDDDPGPGDLRAPIAASPKMREVLALARRVAPAGLTVLIQGETGVGKERLAEFIHRHSDRAGRPEIRINCGAIPETMIEAELFGFERGSFTGAFRSTRGKFELADGSTIFLDEIGDLPAAMQVKLLRVLDEQRFYRLGAATPVQVDVRVIAMTNRDLAVEVASGRFREDLYYRLNVVTIRIPPLRERPEDIPPLVERLLVEFAERSRLPPKKLALDAYDLLYGYPFRGNVRELRNVIERSVVVSRRDYITSEDLLRAVPDLAGPRAAAPLPPARPPPAVPALPRAAGRARSDVGRAREEGVLDVIRRRPDIGLQEILREVGTSKSTGIRLVNELIARGQVVRRDRGKRSRYRLADAAE